MKSKWPLSTATLLMTMFALSACASSGEAANNGGTEAQSSISIAATEGLYLNLPLLVAEEKGMFEKHGVEVEMANIPSGGQLAQAVSNESVELGVQSPPVIQPLIESGNELVTVCSVTHGQGNHIMALPNSDLPSVKDAGSTVDAFKSYDGQTIGVPALGGAVEHSMDYVADLAGVEVTSVAVGTGPSAMASLESGDVDMLFGYPFIAQELIATEKAKSLVDFAQDGPEGIGGQPTVLFGAKAWVEGNEEAVESLCAAVEEGIAFVTDTQNISEVREAVETHFGLSDERVVDEVVKPDGILNVFNHKLPSCDAWQESVEASGGDPKNVGNCEGYFHDLP